MKIELKNIQVFERMSEETTAFVAALYIDGKKAGEAKNDGRGGSTDYYPMGSAHELVRKAEEYCKTLPPTFSEDYPDLGPSQQTLDSVIDDLLEDHLIAKEDAKIQKKTATHIIWQINKIAAMLMSDKGKEAVAKAIAELKLKYPEGKLINTNIHETPLKPNSLTLRK